MRKNLDLLVLVVGPTIPLSIGITAMISGLWKNDPEFMQIGLICIITALSYLYVVKTKDPQDWKQLDIIEKAILGELSKLTKTLGSLSLNENIVEKIKPQQAIKEISPEPIQKDFNKTIDELYEKSKWEMNPVEYFKERLTELGYKYTTTNDKQFITVVKPNTTSTKGFAIDSFKANKRATSAEKITV